MLLYKLSKLFQNLVLSEFWKNDKDGYEAFLKSFNKIFIATFPPPDNRRDDVYLISEDCLRVNINPSPKSEIKSRMLWARDRPKSVFL